MEVAYLDGGSVTRTNGGASFKTDPHLATATGLGILPITDDFSLFARAGLAHWWYTANFNFPVVGPFRFNGHANELIWGGGASVFVDRAQLRLDYEQTKTSPSFEGQTLNMRLRVISLSIVWML